MARRGQHWGAVVAEGPACAEPVGVGSRAQRGRRGRAVAAGSRRGRARAGSPVLPHTPPVWPLLGPGWGGPGHPLLPRCPARRARACLVLLPLYTASGDLFLFVFSHLPKCTAAPMTHLCLLFMLMRLTPLAIAIMCSLPAN